MQWDVFCQVIDNFGDIGVCWRLARDLAGRGHAVRLWVDDPTALAWMAPEVTWEARLGHRVGEGHPGVTVLQWAQAADPQTAPEPGDVVIEAFGCNPPDAFLARMAACTVHPRWVNLEYLSAEDYVERSHRLPSPVWSGPAKGLTKHFFYPGFTPGTGGLLREPGLLERLDTLRRDVTLRAKVLRHLGIEPRPDERLASVFSYAGAPLKAWLSDLARAGVPTHILLTPGYAQTLAADWQARWLAEHGALPAHLRLTALPPLSQPDFDDLLACCDLNLVRGEDSAVRALWTGRPHLWQIYAQDDGVHADKLDAFMTRWMAEWPDALRESVQAWWRAWNGLAPWPERLPDWPDAPLWGQASLASRALLAGQTDLVTQLIAFVTRSG